MDINRAEANFTFELNDVMSFLNSRNYRGSEFFFCRSMRFFIDLKYWVWEGVPHLAVFLVRFNPSDSYYYKMRTEFELRLVNWLGKEDHVLETKNEYIKNTPEGHGSKAFIPINDLLWPSNGWVKDDKLKLKVHLKCGPFYRSYSVN